MEMERRLKILLAFENIEEIRSTLHSPLILSNAVEQQCFFTKKKKKEKN